MQFRTSYKGTNFVQLDDTNAALGGVHLLEQRYDLDKIYGMRKFRLVRADSGAPTIGQIVAQELLQASAAAATSGSTSTLTDTGIAWTASQFAGVFGAAWLTIINNDASAGAAPEAETRRITANTTEVLTITPVFSSTVLVSDTYAITRPGQSEDSADGDAGAEILGVAMTTIAADAFGWVQMTGFNQAIVTSTAAQVGGVGIVAGAAAGIDTADTGDIGRNIGVWLNGTHAADAAVLAWPGFLTIPG